MHVHFPGEMLARYSKHIQGIQGCKMKATESDKTNICVKTNIVYIY